MGLCGSLVAARRPVVPQGNRQGKETAMNLRRHVSFLAVALGLVVFARPAVGGEKPAQSPFKGDYFGPYTYRGTFGNQEGVIVAAIGADGKFTGFLYNTTVKRPADLTGSVNEEGELKITAEFPNQSYTLKGTVTKTKTGHLKGTLVQYSGKENVVGSVAIDLLPASAFTTFTSKEGGFSVLMPGKPTEKVTTAKDPAGRDVETTLFIVDLKTVAYLASYTERPDLATVTADGKNAALENGRDAVVKGLNGKLLTDKRITLGNNPGREFQIEVPNLGVYRSRTYLVGGRFYQVVVMGPQDVATSKAADQFLDSFKLLSEGRKTER
jgi:hypothetical protein